jgi:LmbE family N-acetylglucosaminyl deacetylase
VIVQTDLPVPERALAIAAHADDAEFGCGATLAKWAAHGSTVDLLVLTDGSKGTWDGDADVASLVATREREQVAAASELGVHDVHFLRRVDGELDSDLSTRALVCEVIRRVRPTVVLGHDPWRVSRLHPDHRHAGLLTIEGVVAARDPHFFAEQGLAPHRPSTVLLYEPHVVEHVERVEGHVDAKVASLLRHRSQWRSTMRIDAAPDAQQRAFSQRVAEEARVHGLRVGARAAEVYARIDER